VSPAWQSWLKLACDTMVASGTTRVMSGAVGDHVEALHCTYTLAPYSCTHSGSPCTPVEFKICFHRSGA
jgi:hypothetical protein